MARTPCCDKNGLKKGTWTPEEDRKLVAYVTRYGHWNWSLLPKFAGLQRCGKSCRLRWMNYLRPNIRRGNYTVEEEETIIKLHAQLGNRWSTIAGHLPGRSDNEIKNYWHSKLKKQLQQQPKIRENAGVSEFKDHSPVESSWQDKDSEANTGSFQSTPATSQNSYATPSSPQTLSTETEAAGYLNPALEDNFSFLDVYTEPMIADFWTEPYVADTFYYPGELLAVLVNEPQVSSPVYDAQLWNHMQ